MATRSSLLEGGSNASESLVPTRVRWRVVFLLAITAGLTYIDRLNLGLAGKYIQDEFKFNTQTMGWILSSYQLGYALFQIPGGWLGDRIGPRRALSGIVVWWSTFTALTTLTWSATSMVICRFLFGMGEAGKGCRHEIHGNDDQAP